jgi:hypothetical protein
MATQLLLTIGMNPLPVLVAAYRLLCHFRSQGGLAGITAVFSQSSETEAHRVHNYLAKKLSNNGFVMPSWQEAKVPAGNPDAILTVVRSQILNDADVHLHYTGGTKAMVAHAMQVLVELQGRTVSASYLDINDHRLRCWNLPGFSGVLDERRHWSEFTCCNLAQLHGMTVVSPGSTPNSKSIDAARSLFDCITRDPDSWKTWQSWKSSTWHGSFKNGNEYFEKWPSVPTKRFWPNNPIPWPNISTQGWEDVAHKINLAFSPDSDQPVLTNHSCSEWSLDVKRFQSGQTLEKFVRFLEYEALEYYVFAKMHELVRGTTVHSFRARSSGAISDCEIDVVTCLGYQMIGISCTEAIERGIIKNKGFEIWHRVRQIGGEGARAIVVCPQADLPDTAAKATELEHDTATDIGLRDSSGDLVLPVRFFGFDSMVNDGLSRTLANYLSHDLRWESK